MNTRGYTLESLRDLVRSLERENAKLKSQLLKYGVTYSENNSFDAISANDNEYDEDQGGRIISRYITGEMASAFFSLFRGRHDVYAKRGKNGGYFPQCDNRWDTICPKNHGQKQDCSSCKYRKWTELNGKT